MKKLLDFIFGFEIFAMVTAFASFKLISAKPLAALTAGSVFVLLGVLIVASGVRSKEFRKTLTFWLGCVHLFAISVPMMVARVSSQGLDFSQVSVFGISGPMFHRYSEMFYIALVIGTVVDRVRLRAELRKNSVKDV